MPEGKTLQQIIEEATPLKKRGWALKPKSELIGGVQKATPEEPKKNIPTGAGTTADGARQQLTGVVGKAHSPPGKIVLEVIKHEGAKYADVKVSDLEGPSRKKPLVLYRQALMYFCMRCFGRQYRQDRVAKVYGNRDHTTVMHSVHKIDEYRGAVDPTIDQRKALELLDKLCQHFGVSLPELQSKKKVE